MASKMSVRWMLMASPSSRPTSSMRAAASLKAAVAFVMSTIISIVK